MDAIIDQLYSNNDTIKLGMCIVQNSERNRNSICTNILSVSNKMGFISQHEQFEDRSIASEDTSNYKLVRKNTFAYNPARINVGSIARYRESSIGVVSPMYICFTANDWLSPEYIEYFFLTKQFKNSLNKRLEGSVRQCLSFDALCDIQVPIADGNDQSIIVNIISTISKKINIEELILQQLSMQKQYILGQMFI